MEDTDKLIQEIVDALDRMIVDIGDINDILKRPTTVHLDDAAIRLIIDQTGVPLTVERTWKEKLRHLWNRVSR
jgi:hypothetical protein